MSRTNGEFVYNDDGTVSRQVSLTGSNVPLNTRLFDATGNGISAVNALSDAYLSGILSSGGFVFNGSNWDRVRNNTQGTLLASAARTASAVTPTQTNYNAKGVMLFLDVTAVGGTGGLVVRIFGVDPVSGKNIPINGSPPVVTAVGTTAYALYPGITSANQRGDNYILPRQWNVQVQHQDGTSYTYTLGYALIL